MAISTTQRRSNLEMLKMVMLVRQKYEHVRKIYKRQEKDWVVPKRILKALKAVADIYVRFCQKQFWHTDADLVWVKELADWTLNKYGQIHKSEPPPLKLDPRKFCEEGNPGDLWLLWHAELQGKARAEFIEQQAMMEDLN